MYVRAEPKERGYAAVGPTRKERQGRTRTRTETRDEERRKERQTDRRTDGWGVYIHTHTHTHIARSHVEGLKQCHEAACLSVET